MFYEFVVVTFLLNKQTTVTNAQQMGVAMPMFL